MTDPTTDALHAERIARLTELARRVWPDLIRLRVRNAPSALGRYDVNVELVVETPAFHRVVASVASHPRALDALEAALLVLSSPHPGAMRLALRDLAEHGKLSTAKVALREEPPAWVEQLADKWARIAQDDGGLGGDAFQNGQVVLRSCAAELRERARQP